MPWIENVFRSLTDWENPTFAEFTKVLECSKIATGIPKLSQNTNKPEKTSKLLRINVKNTDISGSRNVGYI